MPADTKSLVVRDLSKSYPTRSEPLQVLSGISFELAPGKAVAIMGPSGSGKSTLLHILGTLETPSSGEVFIEGQNPFSLPERNLAAFRNKTVGFVFQDHHLLPQCSVLENVLVPTLVTESMDFEPEARAKTLLERVGLSGRLEHRPAELSGGERQRTAIARALMNKPKLLLCDEPTGNLDRRNAESVGSLFLELSKEEGTTLVVVTHSQALAGRFERKRELVDGRLVEEQ